MENLIGLILGRTSCGVIGKIVKCLNQEQVFAHCKGRCQNVFCGGGKNAMFWVLRESQHPRVPLGGVNLWAINFARVDGGGGYQLC